MPESNHLFPLLNSLPPPCRHRLTNTVSENREWGGREDVERWPWFRQRINWACSITSREEELRASAVCVWVYIIIYVRNHAVYSIVYNSITILVLWCESQQSLRLKPRVPGLVLYHCMIELQQMDNHKPSQSPNCSLAFQFRQTFLSSTV